MALVNNIDICIYIYIYCVNYFIYTVCMPEMLTSIRVSSINIKPVDHHQAPSLQVRLEQLDKQHLQVLWTTDVVCSVPRLMFSSFAAFYLGEQTFHRTSISIALRGLAQLTLKFVTVASGRQCQWLVQTLSYTLLADITAMILATLPRHYTECACCVGSS